MIAADATNQAPRLWCIGGTDPSGMAGLAADQATAHDLAEAVCLVASCLTIQHPTQTPQVQPIGTAFFNAQLDSMAGNLPDVIKIGLIPDQSTLEALSTYLRRLKQQNPNIWLIWDPVLHASSGAQLSHITDPLPLLALIDVLTPNRLELLQLARLLSPSFDVAVEANTSNGTLFGDADAHQVLQRQAISLLLDAGVSAIWSKDGHGPQQDELCEHLWLLEAIPLRQLPLRTTTHTQSDRPPSASTRRPTPVLTLRHPRQAGAIRGTGCSFATALGCFLITPRLLPDALLLATAYLQQAFCAISPTPTLQAQRMPRLGMPQLSAGRFAIHCPPDTVALGLPATSDVKAALSCNELTPAAVSQTLRFAPLTRPVGIYPIASHVDQLQQLIAAGVSTAQLRLKHDSDIVEQLRTAIALGKQHHVQLFINDHWQLAIELGAYGVHLGQSDLAHADLAKIAQAGLRLGVSTHGDVELYQALRLRPSYVALGHVFDTPTKQMPSMAQGLNRIAQQARWCQAVHLTTVAIGGLDARHIVAVKSAGIDGMAVVRAVAHTPALAYRALQQVWDNA